MENRNPVKSKSPSDGPLHIALLTMDPENYSCRRLREAAKEHGHVLTPLETMKCEFNFNGSSSTVYYDGRELPYFDAIIPRIGTRATAFGAALVSRFTKLGTLTLNRAESIIASRDKLWAYRILERANLPIPLTIYASPNLEPDLIIEKAGGPPLIIKMMQGSQGDGITLAETYDVAKETIDLFRRLGACFIVQEYIQDAKGSDLRCLVLGQEIVGEMRRQASPGDFRSNLHQGGTTHAVQLTVDERVMAINATHQLGLGLAGVDILRTSKGPVLLELNSSPGLKGVESVTGKDIASKIMSYIEMQVTA